MKTDVAIVGGGPGGSTLAMFLLREGIRPAIIEKEMFPRYHIGESMTGECGGVVRALGLEQKMIEFQHPQKWGVHVYGPKGQNPWFIPVARRNEKDEIEPTFTWQVRRSDFDKFMLEEALSRGAEFVHGQALKPLKRDDGSVYGVRVRMADGGEQDIESEVLVDVSGQHTWGYHAGLTSQKVIGTYDRQVAMFSQVANTIRDEDHFDDTIILYKRKVHWAWFIPLNREVVSVGVVSPAWYFKSKNESKQEFFLREIQELNPELKRRIPDPTLVEEVRAIPNYSYHVREFMGKGWMCMGDAHRFIDPIFSFGLYVTMKEAQQAAPVIKAYLEGAHRDDPNPFAEHMAFMEYCLDKYEDLIDGFWAEPFAFAYLAHKKTREHMIDLFAGRIYNRRPNSALDGIRGILKHSHSKPGEADWEDKEVAAA